MKNKILAMLVAFGLVGSVSAVEVNENLSINGFIDASLTQTDTDGTGVGTGKDASYGLDEVEVNFLFNVGSVSGELHIDSNADGATGLDIEQAHFTYSLENGISVTIGRYGSALGLEREDPAGLYTYSRAYGSSAFNLGNVDAASAEGITVSYAAEAWSIGVSIENAAGDDLGAAWTSTNPSTTSGANDANFEVALSYTGVENLTVGGGFFIENDVTPGSGDVETDAWNINATYSVGKALLGAEYTEVSPTGSADMDAFLLLVDYDVSDKLGVAVRYSQWATSGTTDNDTITVAPNYALTDSLGAILEYSTTDVDGGNDSDLIAIELTYTF